MRAACWLAVGGLMIALTGAASAQSLEAARGLDAFEVSCAQRVVVGKRMGAGEGTLVIKCLGADGQPLTSFTALPKVTSGGEPIVPAVPAPVNGIIEITGFRLAAAEVVVSYNGVTATQAIATAGWFSLVPPIAAIFLALWFRQVLVALFGGVWLGQATVAMTTPGWSLSEFAASGFGLLPSLSDVVVGQLADADHTKTILFTLLMGGMVGIISKSGGMRAIVDEISKRAKSPRSAQVATWLMGVLVFFDDYANTILVGNTMRPFTDRFRISREKLAYIVDSTAAPVAALFLISTWIGFEVGLIADMLEVGLPGVGYEVFVRSVPYRFYSILGLWMVILIAWTGRDFGPMLKAEIRARRDGKVLRDGASPMLNDAALEEFEGAGSVSWVQGAAPVLTMIGVVLIALVATGWGPAADKAREKVAAAEAALSLAEDPALELPGRLDRLESTLGDDSASKAAKLNSEALFYNSFSGILSEAASYDALIWGSGLAAILALILTVGAGSLTLNQACDAFMSGVQAMLLAVVVLTLAWSLGEVCGRLQTGSFLAENARGVPSWSLPSLVFLLSAAIAFCTGTSWGTMAIVFPVLGPLLVDAQSEAAFESILLGSVGAVLAGACFGDHASPISDTTVLSSMSSGADHLDHVKTQLPYAATCAGLAVALGFLPAGFGVPPWLGLLLGAGTIFGILVGFGGSADALVEQAAKALSASDEDLPAAGAEDDGGEL